MPLLTEKDLAYPAGTSPRPWRSVFWAGRLPAWRCGPGLPSDGDWLRGALLWGLMARWLPAVVVGVALAWCGLRPARRAGVWLGPACGAGLTVLLALAIALAGPAREVASRRRRS
jgi:hypothetical protein